MKISRTFRKRKVLFFLRKASTWKGNVSNSKRGEKRTKTYISALITSQFLCEAESANIEIENALDLIRKKTFAETQEARKVIELFQKNELPTQEEVASWFGKDKTDASRTMRKFLDKIKPSL
ncbi:MAG: hypothetical protein IJ717_03180 [Treponema sp.]|nr:hypothetical protein [Treponema sp.]